MRPHRDDIAVPMLPPRLRWLGAERDPLIAELIAAGPVLVHFFDFAQLNSVRALPYVVDWDQRYRQAGLATLGIHSPRFGFSGDREKLGGAIERLGIRHPVADDSSYAVWHDYGCEGWPSLFLWDRGGALRWFHFGEGEYEATELAIADALLAIDTGFQAPAPLAPRRPTDAPGALVAPPSPELLPGGSVSDPWRAAGDGDAIERAYAAGGVHASVDGEGELRVALDAGAARTIEVAAPGLYDLALHARHERHRLRLEANLGIAIYSLSFSAGVP